MKDINKIILLGRLGADPTRRETKTGKVVVHFPIATSRKVLDQSQPQDESHSLNLNSKEYLEETQWHQIVAWGKQGEACAKNLKKGQAVYVDGCLRTKKFEDKEGLERLSVEVVADQVSFLSMPFSKSRMEESAIALQS